jgi:hypothetical protein
MTSCNRRIFMTRIVVGTAALAAVGRVYADTPATAGSAPGSAPGTASSSCGDCAFYTAAPGAAAGSCAFAGGKSVTANDGCGAFAERQKPGAN